MFPINPSIFFLMFLNCIFFLFTLQFGKIFLLKWKQNIQLAFLSTPSPCGCSETPWCKVRWELRLYDLEKRTNVSGCSLEVASLGYQGATPDVVLWVVHGSKDTWQMFLGYLWWGAVISGTSGQCVSYRQRVERGLTFCLGADMKAAAIMSHVRVSAVCLITDSFALSFTSNI